MFGGEEITRDISMEYASLPSSPLERVAASAESSLLRSATASIFRHIDLKKAATGEVINEVEANARSKREGSGLIVSGDQDIGELGVKQKRWSEEAERQQIASNGPDSFPLTAAQFGASMVVPMLDPTEIALSVGAGGLLRSGASMLMGNLVRKSMLLDIAEGAAGALATEGAINIPVAMEFDEEVDVGMTAATVLGMSALIPGLKKIARTVVDAKGAPAFIQKYLNRIEEDINTGSKVDAVNPEKIKEAAVTPEEIAKNGGREKYNERANAPENKEGYVPPVEEAEIVREIPSVEAKKQILAESDAPDSIKAEADVELKTITEAHEGYKTAVDVLTECMRKP